MLSSIAVFHFVVLCIINQIHGFEQLPRDIAPTDILSDAVNQIFSSLKFNTNMTNKIKEYSKMHKNFVNLTRHEKNNWIELLKLTSLDIKIVNGTADYTTVINEILYDENKTEVVNDTLNEGDVNKHIEDFLDTLAKLKELYLGNNSYITVNYEMLHQFHKAHQSLRNNTVDRYLTKNDSNFWVTDGRRIFQGKTTKIKHFPFMASVHMFDQFSCAGSIIDDDLVITAASCLQLVHNNRFYRENPSFLSVRIGSSSYMGGDRVPVLEVYFYPSYEPKTLKNNLAIMRLQRVIRFRKKNKNVRKIRVDTNAWALPSNTDGITIIGWGARRASNKIYNPWKNKLAMDVLHFYDLADCRDVYSKKFVTKKNFCAGFISRGGGACNRDVGAPGVVNDILTGVVSFGSPNCGAPDSPTVFTKLGYYIDWIEDIMEQEPPRHSVRMTSRRPHLFHTVMSTRPSPEMNFLIEPIDLHKVPDIRDLDMRMPRDDKNEFLNTALSSKKPASLKQTYPSMQIMNEKKGQVDLTRVRDETNDSVEAETTYEPAGFQAIRTVMDNFDSDENSSGETFLMKITTEEAIARTKAQNKKLKPSTPKWQMDLIQESKSVEDATEIPIDNGQFVNTDNFELNKMSSSGIDKLEKIVSSDDNEEDSEAVPVQQPLPILFSNEKDLSVETSNMEVVQNKIDGGGHVIKFTEKNPNIQEIEETIDKLIDNLNFDEMFRSEEVLKRKVFNSTRLPAMQKQSQEVKPTPVDKDVSAQEQGKKPESINNDKLPLQEQEAKHAPVNDDVFPLQNQNMAQAPGNDDVFPLQNQETKPAPTNYYVSLQIGDAKPAPTDNVVPPQQDHETKPAPNEDIITLLFLSENERKGGHDGSSNETAGFKDLTYRNIL